jgi:hypothetical protein
MEALQSSETLVKISRSARHHNTEDSHVHTHRCKPRIILSIDGVRNEPASHKETPKQVTETLNQKMEPSMVAAKGMTRAVVQSLQAGHLR